MNRREVIALAGAAAGAMAIPPFAFAQQVAKLSRVALVTGAIAVDQMQIGKDVNWSAVIEELAAKGFAEGKTVALDRYLMPEAATTLARANAEMVLAGNPDAIFFGGAPLTALAALALNKTIPMIVETGDLFAQGIVTNLAHPGGNVTGVSVTANPDTEGKMLALIAEVVPGAKSFAYTQVGINGQFNPQKQVYVDSVAGVAERLGLKMVPIMYAAGGGETEFKKVFDQIAANKAEMIVFGTDTAVSATSQQLIISNLALDAELPAIAPWNGFTNAGGLLVYGGNLPDLARKCADYVALTLNGTKAGDLPVLEPTVFDLVVNLKTAKAIGLTVPSSVLLQATQVIA